MFRPEYIQELQAGLARDSVAFLPELILCVGIVLLLLLRLFRAFDRVHLGWVALGSSVAALAAAVGQWQGAYGFEPLEQPRDSLPLFSGLLVYDNFTIYLRVFLLVFTALIIWLTMLTGIPDREDSADFYCLLLGATVGMSLMASANHLLMVFIGVEMASLPSYALAGFLKGKRQSSEAALKYVVYGGGASGVMLYGISLLAGRYGTGYLPDLAVGFSKAGAHFDLILLMGMLFIMVGIAFKLAAVPFHFWCPDVFEGAAAEIAGFLSVASKGAALALLGRIVLVLAGISTGGTIDFGASLNVANNLVPSLAFFAALTATFGNIAAYLQTNLKRLLAYSTIAQAGYMMMGLAALTAEGMSAVLFYLIVYLFMNLGAFAIVAFLRNQTGSEDLSSFRGYVQRSPLLVVTMGFFMFSLVGVPPLAGFAAKFQIFQALFDAAEIYAKPAPALSNTMYALVVIGGLNTVISLVYYLKVLKVMVLEKPIEELEGQAAPAPRLSLGSSFFASALAAVVLFIGLDWNGLYICSDQAVDRFYKWPKVSAPPVSASVGAAQPKPRLTAPLPTKR